jgi:hypothetical protein
MRLSKPRHGRAREGEAINIVADRDRRMEILRFFKPRKING